MEDCYVPPVHRNPQGRATLAYPQDSDGKHVRTSISLLNVILPLFVMLENNEPLNLLPPPRGLLLTGVLAIDLLTTLYLTLNKP